MKANNIPIDNLMLGYGESAKAPQKWIRLIKHLQGDCVNVTAFDGPYIKSYFDNSLYLLFIGQYVLLALISLIGNSATIYYIVRYKLFIDSTQSFLLNIMLSYFVQTLITLPFTLRELLSEYWRFGQFLCYALPILQDVPMHVVMMSHILIAWDRKRWLRDPFAIRLPGFICSCATWMTAIIISLPFPIYIIYIDLGNYDKHLNGIGMCMVNLVHNIGMYLRGLFLTTYVLPMFLICYLYIRTSRYIRAPNTPMGTTRFEARAQVRNKQRQETYRAVRIATKKLFDLYDAELDVDRERQTQHCLGGMAATQCICICPIMIFKLARLVVQETYEFSVYIDLTALSFVWMAFLPAAIIPCVYSAWMLPGKPFIQQLYRFLFCSEKWSGAHETVARRPDDSMGQTVGTDTSQLTIISTTKSQKKRGDTVTMAGKRKSTRTNEYSLEYLTTFSIQNGLIENEAKTSASAAIINRPPLIESLILANDGDGSTNNSSTIATEPNVLIKRLHRREVNLIRQKHGDGNTNDHSNDGNAHDGNEDDENEDEIEYDDVDDDQHHLNCHKKHRLPPHYNRIGDRKLRTSIVADSVESGRTSTTTMDQEQENYNLLDYGKLNDAIITVATTPTTSGQMPVYGKRRLPDTPSIPSRLNSIEERTNTGYDCVRQLFDDQHAKAHGKVTAANNNHSIILSRIASIKSQDTFLWQN